MSDLTQQQVNEFLTDLKDIIQSTPKKRSPKLVIKRTQVLELDYNDVKDWLKEIDGTQGKTKKIWELLCKEVGEEVPQWSDFKDKKDDPNYKPVYEYNCDWEELVWGENTSDLEDFLEDEVADIVETLTQGDKTPEKKDE